MTYYMGLMLKDRTLIAADTRVSIHEYGTGVIKDGFPKIGKISQYAYFSGAGNMNACNEVCCHFRENNIKFPEDILQIGIDKIKNIHNKQIQRSQQGIPNFEEEKEEHGYLNLSMIVAGISKENKPIMFFMNNFNGFVPQLIRGCLNGTATNMSHEINQITKDFFKKAKEDFIRLNENLEIITNQLQSLFKVISNKDKSVSPTFDLMIVDSEGVDSLRRI